MALDTPARLAILGAGPIGLEAALYGRFLGYEVELYERGRAAEHVLRWGHVQLFTPWGMNLSPLGAAALTAQDSAWRRPPDDGLCTGREWAEHYLQPLAASDLLADNLHLQTEVVAIGRQGLLKGELVGDEDRGEPSFRLLLRNADGQERIATADAVLDCTGTYGQPNWLGAGGIPALGECAMAGQIEYGLPDVCGRDRARFAGRHVLVIGQGYSAATNVVALAALADRAPGTRVTWLTRRSLAEAPHPVHRVAEDPLRTRDALAERANALAAAGDPVQRVAGLQIDALQTEPAGGFLVRFVGDEAPPLQVDCILANVGFRPDFRLASELQVHLCYASDAPMKLAAKLQASATRDCLAQPAVGAQTLLNPEPDYYVLGAKSYGRDPRFLFAIGLEQIRQVYSIIGDRENLNLYAQPGFIVR